MGGIVPGELERLLQILIQPVQTSNPTTTTNIAVFRQEQVKKESSEQTSTVLNPPTTWGSAVYGETILTT
jgi:hypothetical protein